MPTWPLALEQLRISQRIIVLDHRGARTVGLNVPEGNDPALRTHAGLGFGPDPAARVVPGVLALTVSLTQSRTWRR